MQPELSEVSKAMKILEEKGRNKKPFFEKKPRKSLWKRIFGEPKYMTHDMAEGYANSGYPYFRLIGELYLNHNSERK